MSEHNQQDFWKEAGLAQEDIAKIKAEDLGLRQRRREKEPKAPPVVQQPQKQRPARVVKSEVVKKELPSTEEEFADSYTSINKTGTEEDKQWRSSNISLLYSIAKKVHQAGGIVDVLSIGGWNALAKELTTTHKEISDNEPSQLLGMYVKHLVEYEFNLRGEQLAVKQGVELEKSLTEALFIRGELAEIIKRPSQGLQILKEEVVVFPRGVQELGIEYEDINLAKIEALCGEESLDIRVQHPMDYGFNINKMTNLCGKMTIKQYCEYQRNYKVEAFKKANYGEQLKNGKVFFGVNFQPSNLDIFSSLWEKLQSNFLGFGQNFDLLSYLDAQIPGCSSPQFYLKVKGCWTGGHQENLAMCAVNINHGPDASQWFTIPYSEVERVRKALMEKFKMDLYKDQGLWYQKINWFIQNGYPIKRILQQQGDIVVSGPGTLHWVRSFGVALQSAWNIFPKNYNMIQCALHRFQQNLAIRLERTSVIPFKALLVKYLQHEYQTISDKILEIVIVNLEQWLSNEHRLRLELTDSCDLGLQSAVEQKLDDLSSFCEICKQEVFNFYIYSWTGQNIACLQCLAQNPALHNKSPIRLYYKYHTFHLKSLFDAAKQRKKTEKRTVGYNFCDGRHIGKVQCPVKVEGKRKRQREPLADYLTTESANQDSNPNEQVLEKILQYYESLSQQSQKTLAEVVEAKRLKFSLHVKNKTIQTQTDDLTCTNCYSDMNFQKMKQPIKKHRSNKDYEQMNKEEELDKPLKDYQPKRYHYQRSQKREDFENKNHERREESKDNFQREGSRHQRKHEQRENPHDQRRDDKWRNERSNRDRKEDDNRDNEEGRDNRDNRQNRDNRENGSYRNNRDNRENRDNRHHKDSKESGNYRNNRDDRDKNDRRDHHHQGNRGRDHQNNYRNEKERRPYNDSNNRDRPTNDRSDYKREEPKATKPTEQTPFDY